MASGEIDAVTTRRAPGLRGPQLIAVLLLAAAAPLWAILVAQLWATVPASVLHLVQPAAPTVTIVAAILWVGHNSRRREENSGLLIETVRDLTRPASRQTGPLRLHRVP